MPVALQGGSTMTVFGKILTFIILVLALAQAALHVMFHIAQTNYAAQNLKMEADLRAAYASVDAANAEKNKGQQEAQAALAAKQGEVDTLKNAVAAAEAKSKEQTQQIGLLNNQVAAAVANQQRGTADVQQRDQEVTRMEQAVRSRDEKILELVKTGNELRQVKVKAENEARAYKDRNEQLVEALAEREKEIVRIRTTSPGSGVAGAVPGNGGTGGTAVSFKNPPPQNVEGLITKTDPSGMVTISVGTDSGVVKGNTLEVYRLDPPKYLGTIRIIEARNHEAVGKPVSKPLGQIMQGDRVSGKIL